MMQQLPYVIAHHMLERRGFARRKGHANRFETMPRTRAKTDLLGRALHHARRLRVSSNPFDPNAR
jgi:hypothetical protein